MICQQGQDKRIEQNGGISDLDTKNNEGNFENNIKV